MIYELDRKFVKDIDQIYIADDEARVTLNRKGVVHNIDLMTMKKTTGDIPNNKNYMILCGKSNKLIKKLNEQGKKAQLEPSGAIKVKNGNKNEFFTVSGKRVNDPNLYSLALSLLMTQNCHGIKKLECDLFERAEDLKDISLAHETFKSTLVNENEFSKSDRSFNRFVKCKVSELEIKSAAANLDLSREDK